MTPSSFVLGRRRRRTAVRCLVLVWIFILADVMDAAEAGQHVGHGDEPAGGNDQADPLALLSRGRQRHLADAADVAEDLRASNVRDLKKDKRKKSDAGGVRSVDTTKVSCKSAPDHPDCATPAPTAAPTDQCESASFTTPREEYDGGNSNGVTKFSFTNEIDFAFSCDDLVGSVGSNGAIESVLVAYQNNLLMQYGCSDEISYGAAVVTDLCILADSEDSGCISSLEEVCPSKRERQLQNSSVKSATVRYKYNTMGNCRRTCAEQSLPKESDVVGGGRRRSLGSIRRRTQDESRQGLVTLLNVAGVPTTGVVVISDGKNDCSNGSTDCCSENGKCCGVTPGCSCPSVSQTYCTATGCDLPGCCGPYHLEMLNRASPPFVGCSYLHPVCLCQTQDCYPDAQCGSYGVCTETADTCPGS